MRKNVAGQTVGAQMLTAADGTAFTGAVTVFVTGDGGAQAQGSVGSGACVHEGNGYHSYAPAQAETNYDHVAYTFTGTGAAPATTQVYTTFPQTGDAFARLGAPAGASVSADVAAVQADTNDIQTRLPAALVSGRMDSSVGAMAANVMTAAAAAADLTTELQNGLATAAALATVDTVVDAIQAKTDALPSDPADQSLIIAATDAITTAVAGVQSDTNDIQTRLPAALVGGRMDASVGAMAADVVTSTAVAASAVTEIQTGLATSAALASVAAKTDLIPAAPAAVGDIPTAAQVADAVHDEVVDGAVTFRQSTRLQNSVLFGKASGLGTSDVRYRDLADTKDRIAGTVDADGNRTAVTRDAT